MKKYYLLVMENDSEADRIELDSATGRAVQKIAREESGGMTKIPKQIPKIPKLKSLAYNKTSGRIQHV